MMWFRLLRRRLFGPSAADLLKEIAVKLDSFTASATKIANSNHRTAIGIEQAEARLTDLLEQLHSEPFMALKKWIDECTKSNADHADQRREFKDRERQLLERWRTQVDGMQATIDCLCHPVIKVARPQVEKNVPQA